MGPETYMLRWPMERRGADTRGGGTASGAIHRSVIGCAAAVVSLVLAGGMLVGGGDRSFHSVQAEVTPTVTLPGLPPAQVSAGELELRDLDSLAATTLILIAMAAVTALVSLLGVMASESLALEGRRVVKVMLGAPPRAMVRRTVRRWSLRMSWAALAGGGLAVAAALAMRELAPPGISFQRPSLVAAAAGLAAALAITVLCAVVPVVNLHRSGKPLLARAENLQLTDPRPRQFNRVLRMTLQLTIAVTVITSSALLVYSDRGGQVQGAGRGLPAGEQYGETVVGLVSPARSDGGEPAVRAALYASALEAVRAVPELVAESLATPGAWLDLGAEGMAQNECGRCSNGGLPEPIRVTRVKRHAVMPGFFAARGLRFVAGRGFSDSGALLAGEVVINQAYARAHFRDPPVVGKTLALNGPEEDWHVVVGVVADVPSSGLGASGSPYTVYYSALEHPPGEMELVVSAASGAGADPEDPGRLVSRALASIPGDPVLLSGVRGAGDELGRVFGTAVWFGSGGRMAGVLAALVAVLAMVGALRVHVGARLREMGIRAALGAGPAKLRRRIVGEALRIGATGTGVGLWGAMLVVGVFGPPGVEPFSASVFVVVTAVFLAAAVWAVLPAARLAGTADPRSVMER
ncbi:MAG: FtsX-like permease family protein [Gemmatimonadetes bacterium]|nr:FtsX-like permease family protein [Gemmatimonadota bacterium]MYJ09179.1 FtsX-like permease family protein [Gemmatimonadota bacterium]